LISANVNLGAGNHVANIANSTNAAIDLNITGNISGAGGTLRATNSGTLRLAGANTFSSLVVSNGATVLQDGTHSGSVTINTGGTLGGIGSIAGAVTNLDGVIAPGDSPGTLTVGSLNLASGAELTYELDQAGVVGSGVNDLIITGDLTLDGDLNIVGLANFAGGVYRLINYSGTLTDNGLNIGLLSGTASVFAPGDLSIDTSVLGQVNLIVVPEPSTVALAGIGAALLGLQVIRRRRNR
jgi:fibronectin-binding autotransporter adhesin